MKERVRVLIESVLPIVDLDSDFLFSELDSLGVISILMALSDEFGIKLDSHDATPKNFKNIDSIASLVERKMLEKANPLNNGN